MLTSSVPIMSIEKMLNLDSSKEQCLEKDNALDEFNNKHREMLVLVHKIQGQRIVNNLSYWREFTEIILDHYIWLDNNFNEFVRWIPNQVIVSSQNSYKIVKNLENALHTEIFTSIDEEKVFECIYLLQKYCHRCNTNLVSFGFDIVTDVMSITGVKARIMAEKCVAEMNKIRMKYSNKCTEINNFWSELAPHVIKLYVYLCDNFEELFSDRTCHLNLDKWREMAYDYENNYYKWSEHLIFIPSEKKLQRDVLIQLKKYRMLIDKQRNNNCINKYNLIERLENVDYNPHLPNA